MKTMGREIPTKNGLDSGFSFMVEIASLLPPTESCYKRTGHDGNGNW